MLLIMGEVHKLNHETKAVIEKKPLNRDSSKPENGPSLQLPPSKNEQRTDGCTVIVLPALSCRGGVTLPPHLPSPHKQSSQTRGGRATYLDAF